MCLSRCSHLYAVQCTNENTVALDTTTAITGALVVAANYEKDKEDKEDKEDDEYEEDEIYNEKYASEQK